MLLITGMNGNLGRALSLECIARGLPLSGVVRNAKAAEQVQDLVEKGAKLFVADLSKVEPVRKLIQEIALTDSMPDHVILNAASIEDDISNCGLTDGLREIIFTNLTGPLLLLSGLLPHLRNNKGRAIAISSLSARLATDKGRIAYPASKAGLSMAFSALRLQPELDRVRFITVEPGLMGDGPPFLSISYARAAERIINLVEAKNPEILVSFPVLSDFLYRLLRNLPRKITASVIILRKKFGK
ncbi:MAG: SDR family NAD(P)-dependent oxidoreductase [Pseudomonadota bacterium]|nr:SDR family NAD(P)-dependent oxidoreductase [Pseudomonadota bacterium]